ncbi:branched-chain amino acid ABC transporter [Paramagnetospirillum kuznetsovii]|uniref:Branched-chain amino acid ABC transporter n=1 Tax=Paramagnetospirillum kuznetsovii TaxID=2053833 RepID=A0A364NZE1_9PROT|nr:ABC transporter substrate-binding protein [Paramagnetospirillum kuznetsovii]RAU22436.1 branched-chain amino acid ABC transporter [Paramagnetospirillum kuznetsovii]
MSDNAINPSALTRRQFTATAAVGAVAASVGLPARSARAATPLKLGVLLPRSGHLALIGQACQRGAEIGLPMLKDLGYSVELMNADTESNPDVGRTQAEKLIREGANMLMGCFDSATTLAVAGVAEQKGVPFVVNIGAEPKITEQGFKYVFRNFPSAGMLGKGGLLLYKDMFAASGVTPKTAVLLHINDSFGMGMLGGINALMPKLDLPFTIVETIAYDPKARDLSIEVAKAKAAKADFVMTVTRLNDAILLVREMVKQQMDTMGITSPGSPGMYDKQFLKALGKYADFCSVNIPWFDPKQDMATALSKTFEKAFPDESCDLNVGFTFEAVLIAADAHKRAGSNDPQVLTEALRATNIEKRVMLGGPIKFEANGQNMNLRSAVVQNLNGRPTVVLPAESAEAKLVFPAPAFKSRT